MRSSTFHGAVVLAGVWLCGGCIVEDRGGTRGRSHAPEASVPDSGSPIRRESAAETFREAAPAEEPPPGDDGGTLEIEPRRTPPPPVQ